MNPILAELPKWVQIGIAGSPMGLLAIGLVGAVVAFVSYLQRRRADLRAEWWRRVQFAIEMAASDDDETSRIGAELLATLAKQRESTSNDTKFLTDILRIVRGQEAPVIRLRTDPLYFPSSWLPPDDVDSTDDQEGGTT